MAEQAFFHVTVMREEAVAALLPRPGGVYVDATLGGGGHARLLLDRSAPDGGLIAFDRDELALEHARTWLREAACAHRATLVHDTFAALPQRLRELGARAVDGVLCDLGVSSPQVDEGERGFSYQRDAPLDMRMDRSAGQTAADLLRTLPEGELARVIRRFGEERWAARIAAFIVRERARSPLATTGQLVDVIKAAIPAAARRTGPHPAKRTFQALRIAVNDELGALQALLAALPDALAAGGRAAILTFHSLEDRLVKQSFAEFARGCVCPPRAPRCVCGRSPVMRVVTKKPLLPGAAELAANPRARSAKLRVAERL